MRWTYHQLVADAMGEPEGVLMVDETGFVKKGKESVGVARQYGGPLGKVENCQVGVFAGYASRQGYALVDQRLFLPEAWFTDAYAARRTRCNVPTALTLQSKPQLAAAMVQAIAHEGLLPFREGGGGGRPGEGVGGGVPLWPEPRLSGCRGRRWRRHDVRRDSCRHAVLAPTPPH